MRFDLLVMGERAKIDKGRNRADWLVSQAGANTNPTSAGGGHEGGLGSHPYGRGPESTTGKALDQKVSGKGGSKKIGLAIITLMQTGGRD